MNWSLNNISNSVKGIVGSILFAVLVAASFGVAVQSAQPGPFDPDFENTIVMGASPGGSVFGFVDMYEKWKVKGKYVRFEGPCISACTFGASILPPERICAGEDATFLFHGVSTRGMFNKPMTQWVMENVYNETVRDVLKEHGFDGTKAVDRTEYPLGLIEVSAEELGIQPCPSIN